MREQISQITQDIWSSFLGLEVQPDNAQAMAPGTRSLTACVQITGPWQGAVAVECPQDLANTVAASMMGMEPAEVSKEDAQDALGELANITGGNVKALLPEPCRLSLPAVAEGIELTMRVPGLVLEAEVPFDCLGHTFVVRVLRRKD